MERVMIDIETLGLEPGAVVLSIGAVRFTPHEITEEFYRNIDLQSSMDAGLGVDPETLDWWLQEERLEASDCLTGGEPLEDSLRALAAFVNGCNEYWANSPAMDLSVLEAAYAAVGMEEPWNYDEERDQRTIEALAPDDYTPPRFEGTEHNALDDARHQARVVGGILQEL